jgi:hypothetical protein
VLTGNLVAGAAAFLLSMGTGLLGTVMLPPGEVPAGVLLGCLVVLTVAVPLWFHRRHWRPTEVEIRQGALSIRRGRERRTLPHAELERVWVSGGLLSAAVVLETRRGPVRLLAKPRIARALAEAIEDARARAAVPDEASEQARAAVRALLR